MREGRRRGEASGSTVVNNYTVVNYYTVVIPAVLSLHDAVSNIQ